MDTLFDIAFDSLLTFDDRFQLRIEKQCVNYCLDRLIDMRFTIITITLETDKICIDFTD